MQGYTEFDPAKHQESFDKAYAIYQQNLNASCGEFKAKAKAEIDSVFDPLIKAYFWIAVILAAALIILHFLK